VFSDNGTNFVAGERELREAVEAFNQEKILNQLSRRGIEWHFSPPAAPHFGGVWERLVKSCKAALRTTLNNRQVNEEVLRTVFTHVEALLNGRPLTHLSMDPEDLEPITPNHFLLGRANANLPPNVIENGQTCFRRRWLEAQFIVNQVWKRWLKEYVPALTERRKWLRPERDLRVGDLVIVVDNNSPRGQWPLGRVLRLLPGKDGVVRTAEVKTKTGVYIRPAVKLCLLESSDL